MKEEGKQVKNGKAFEYALAITYKEELEKMGLLVFLEKDNSFLIAKKYFYEVEEDEQKRFMLASKATLPTMIKIEPGLISPRDSSDALKIRLASDAEGRSGDVRDVIFTRPSSNWEIGFSAKNNNEDAKHSRLGPRKKNPNKDWGKNWYGMLSTEEFWNDFNPVLEKVLEYKRSGVRKWNQIHEIIESEFYVPTLHAFKSEIERQYHKNKDLPSLLTSFFIGNRSFYKIIKNDQANLVIVRAFNYNGELNKTINRHKSSFNIPEIDHPTKIIYFDFPEDKEGMKNSLELIFDKGWSINLRIHTGDGQLTRSLKFAVTLTGNPPILFSQFIFQE